ncbi:MAG: response regulator [Calditrichaeota bacterium]|nr:response regulator [Calditrichota bacterium]MBT7619311.1 response regulator [Calditrichota bacterium]MBT7787883.1 response regulator [Calditrichota bacterium]
MSKERSHKATKVLERLSKKLNRQVVGSLVACVHCGMCTDSCHYVQTNPDDPTYAPAYKADRLRKIFKKHHDWTGRVIPWWVGAKSVWTDEDLEELKDIAFGKCTNCRRCSINCPMGVDFATFNRMTRGLLVSVGVMPEGVSVVSKDQWEIGNQMGVLKEDYVDTLEWMAEELQGELEDDSDMIPIDKMDAEVVYSINPREAKYDPRTIADAAKIFHFAGENWTMPSEGWDMTNFGLFSGDDDLGGAVAKRLFDKVIELRGKKLVISECGHGYRSTRCEGPNWAGMDIPFEMESSVDTMLRYVKEGRIKVDKSRNKTPVTFHDSCNNARSCGLFEEPRELLNLVCENFTEMYPNRAENYCCTGGGGAMSMSEYTPRRLKSGKVKADQLKATKTEIVVTSCHNCVDGLNDVIRHYKLGMEVTQLVNLVANALVIPAKIIPVSIPDEVLVLAGKKILVVDDEPDILTFFSTVFEDNGATVFTATDGDEAIKLAMAEKPDLVTLDISMPGKDGGKVFEELRTNAETSTVKVCIITGRPELRKLIYDRKVQPPEGYLDKPVDEDTLMLNVRKVLELA